MHTMKFRLFHLLLLLLLLAGVGFCFRGYLPRAVVGVMNVFRGKHTVEERVAAFGPQVRARLQPVFAAAEVPYPPERFTLVGIKATRTLQIWAAGPGGQWKHLKDYPILGMSGKLGPKLREGDGQVPEGLYRVESLNPNSLFHLSLRLNYPNEQDKTFGRLDKRDALGGDIMIHGNDCSVGCLAMGDPAAEDLFVLAAETGIEQVSVILTPVDFRMDELPAEMPLIPSWMGDVYEAIRRELAGLGDPVSLPN